MADILTGEKVQQLADVYIGNADDFKFNPVISKQTSKFQTIDTILTVWNNPPVIFCYSHRIRAASVRIASIQNPCVIVFGNSDQNITYELAKPFLDSTKVIHIFCQNIMFTHVKASLLPIGIANSQWVHGNLTHIENIDVHSLRKTNSIFCSFSVQTNWNARSSTQNAMARNGLQNARYSSQGEYIRELSKSHFSICPEGNGMDTHRLWESLYVHSVPILVRNSFTETIHAMGLPCVLITSWDTFDKHTLPPYASFLFDTTFHAKISFLKYKADIYNYLQK